MRSSIPNEKRRGKRAVRLAELTPRLRPQALRRAAVQEDDVANVPANASGPRYDVATIDAEVGCRRQQVFVVRIDGLEPLTGRCSQMKGISAAQENAARERR
jgi:hypothetical protein